MHVQFVRCIILPAVVSVAKTWAASTQLYQLKPSQLMEFEPIRPDKVVQPTCTHAMWLKSTQEAHSTVQNWQQDIQRPAQDASCSPQGGAQILL